MKLYKSILFVALAAVATAFTSCSDEGKWDAYNEEAETYSFAQSKHDLSVSATDVPSEIKVMVYRSTTNGSASLPVTVTTNSDALSAPSTVSFAEGSNVAEYVFTVNSPEIGVTHKATVEIAEGSVSPSGNASIAVSLVVNYVWNDWATGTITDYFNGCQVPGLKIMKAEGARAYRLMEPYKEFFMTEYGYTEAQWAAYSCPYIEFSVVEGAAVTFKTFKADVYDSEAGYMIYGYLPSEFLEKYAELDALSQLLDSKTVMLAPFWAVSPEVGGWGADYPVYIELEGDFEF